MGKYRTVLRKFLTTGLEKNFNDSWRIRCVLFLFSLEEAFT